MYIKTFININEYYVNQLAEFELINSFYLWINQNH